jgi:hypothetical protein
MPSSSPSANARPSDSFLAGLTVLSTSSPAVDRTSPSLRGHLGQVQPTISQSFSTAFGSAAGVYAGSGLRNSVSLIMNSSHSMWPPGSAREGISNPSSLETMMIRLTQQHHQPAHSILDLAVIYEADHQRNMDYVISAYQFLWWVLKDIMLGNTDGRRKPRRGRALR